MILICLLLSLLDIVCICELCIFMYVFIGFKCLLLVLMVIFVFEFGLWVVDLILSVFFVIFGIFRWNSFISMFGCVWLIKSCVLCVFGWIMYSKLCMWLFGWNVLWGNMLLW